jgi:peptide deformylase
MNRKNVKPDQTKAHVPKIVQNGSAVLRQTAETVLVADITTPRIQKLIADMKSALDPEKDGVALAAPQIGVALRIFIVSGLILATADEKYAPKNIDTMSKSGVSDMVFINPEIIKTSREKEEVEEGCLSVRYLYGKIKRAKKVTLRAYDERGHKIERGASGLLAQIFQHETDHLNGVLFIDRARDIQEILPEEMERRK